LKKWPELAHFPHVEIEKADSILKHFERLFPINDEEVIFGVAKLDLTTGRSYREKWFL
jgi:hypothetical protein